MFCEICNRYSCTGAYHNHYVALVADATGRYAHVYVPEKNWSTVVNQLENIGCEVIENQTYYYELEDFASPESLSECGLVTIAQLTGVDSNFTPF